MEKYLLVDGNSMMFRAYFATAELNLKTSSGIPTGALRAFVNMLRKSIQTYKPTHIAVAFDKGKNTFRHKAFTNYKSDRKPTPEDLLIQMPIIKEFLDAIQIKWLHNDDLEADDIIGSLQTLIESNSEDYTIDILTSDKDLLQLIDDKTTVHLMKSGITNTKDVNYESFLTEWNFEPKYFSDYKALVGDKSDNISGVFKIGEKTGRELISKYQTINNIYKQIDLITTNTRKLLLDDAENAFISKKLAKIINNYDLNIKLDELKRRDKMNIDFFKKYELDIKK